MARFAEGWARIGRAVAAGATLAPLLGLAALADEPGPRDDAQRAREILGALRDLQRAVQQEEGANEPAVVPPPRPEKVVRPPSLGAAQVDAMLDRLYDATGAKASPLVDDEAFVRRVYLDVTGKLPTPEQVDRFVRAPSRASAPA